MDEVLVNHKHDYAEFVNIVKKLDSKFRNNTGNNGIKSFK